MYGKYTSAFSTTKIWAKKWNGLFGVFDHIWWRPSCLKDGKLEMNFSLLSANQN